MNTADLLSRLRSHDIRLWAENDKLRYSAPKDAMTADLLAEIRKSKDELLNLLRNTERFRQAVPLVQVERTDPLRLSFAQERLWFLYQLFPENAAYNVPLKVRLAGIMDIPALRKSLQALVDRHESLRTFFPMVDGKPAQVIRDDCPVPLLEHDLKELPEAEQEIAADKLIEEEILRPFDLTHGPVIRAALLRITDQDHILLITVHHIVTDGWSHGVIQRDLAAFYNAQLLQQTPTLPALPIQYVDFAHWQRQWLTGEVLEDQLRYWRGRLADVSTLDLPTDRPRPPVQTHSGASYSFQLSESLTQDLQVLSRQAEVTLATTLLAAFQVLLARYTGQTDIAVGSPIANRTRSELENLVGFFVNTLVMRTDLSGDPTFREVLARVHEVALGAYDHQDLPFEQLVGELQPERDFSRNPLFQVVFAFQNVPREAAAFQGLTICPMAKEITTTRMDLECFVWEGEERFQVVLVFNTDLFDRETIERFGAHYQKVLADVVRDPVQRFSQISLLDEAERQRLLMEWNATEVTYPREATVAERFEAQAAATPDAVAVVFVGDTLTYAELNARANCLAHHLLEQGIGPEEVVGVVLPRSVDLVIGLLGILKAGGAYLPIDPSLPSDRIAFMVADVQASVVVTHTSLATLLPAASLKVVCLDAEADRLTTLNEANLLPRVEASNLAYIIYTSGSTGTPKGVAITHSNLLNLVNWHQQTFEVVPSDRATQVAGLSFDAAVWELWPHLLNGASVVLAPEEEVRTVPEQLRDWLVAEQITISFLPTPLAESVLSLSWPAHTSLRIMLTGGDQLHQYPAPTLPFRLVNNYGPTENTVVTTSGFTAPCPPTFKVGPSIGRPIANTQVYVLDWSMQPVPVGVFGELYIGGDGLARNYLRRPALTAERFVPHPLSHAPGARLYRTGDVVRYRSDGTLEFKGRQDHQVKLRGYRIELGEIETVLSQHPGVAESVALVREDEPGAKRLVGYVVPAEEPLSPGELREFLKQSLPEYMVPAIFMKLDALPLTPNGKVDRRALPVPESSQLQVETDFVAPRSPYEEAVAEIWRDSLGLEQVGIHDNFFDLGGHSLLAAKIVSRLKTTFDADLPLRAFFDSPTIAGVSATLAIARRGEEPTEKAGILPVTRSGTLPLSFAQERFWVLDQFHTDRAVYNGPAGFRLKGSFQFEVFEQSVQALVDRHEILRTTFASAEGGPHQVIAPTLSLQVPLQTCSGLSREEQAGMIQQAFLEEKRFQFDLVHGPLFRARLLRFAEDDHLLVLNLHHIIHDAWSLEVIIKDLVAAYTAGCSGQAVTLPILPIQYVDYAHWQRELLEGPIGREQLAFWKNQLADLPPALPLPTDYARPAVQTFRGARENLRLPAELTAPLRALNRQEGTTLFMVLLATLQYHLHRLTGTNDILVGSPIAGRDQEALQGLIGCFLNTLVLRTDLSGDLTGRDLLKRVREVVLNAYENQDVPFEKLLAEVQPVRDLSRTPVFQVMLNMHSFDDQSLPLPGLVVTRTPSADINSLFDMTLYFQESADEIRMNLVYNADLFAAERMTEFMGQFQIILEQMIKYPDRPLEAFSLVTSTARSCLPDLKQPLDAEWEGPVWRRLEHHARQRGAAIAMVGPGEAWTYQELEARSNQLAHRLLEQGIKAREVVAVYAVRRPELVLGLLGILKAGAAFMILDPSYPATRLLEMLHIARPRGLIHLEEAGPLPDEVDAWAAGVPCHVRLPAFATGETDAEESWGSTLKTVPEVEIQPDDVAYVTFTSGSTGDPKCLPGTHRPLSHFMRWYTRALQLTAADRVTLFSGLAHDPLLRDVFTPLWIGGTLCIPDPEALALGCVVDWMNEQKVTLMHLTPPLVDVLSVGQAPSVVPCTSLRYAVFGGESLRPVHLDCIKQLAPQATCVNGYGATETPQIMCWYVVPPECPCNGEQVPIGQGIDGVQILVLNNTGQLAGIGELGEIHIRTPYLTLGYVNDEALTSARFIPDPFRPEAGYRMYRTGDLGRYRPDGTVEFVGRGDDQVKIRGYRVELGEIETALAQHLLVHKAVVLHRDEGPAGPCLVGYLLTSKDSAVSSDALRRFLKERLPDYMVPSAWVQLEDFPLTPNGKIDRKALPAPEAAERTQGTRYVAPRSELEELLVEVWQETLKIDRIGIHDNFFELGGHSLSATRVIARLRDELDLDIPLGVIFEYPVIEQLTLDITARLADVYQDSCGDGV